MRKLNNALNRKSKHSPGFQPDSRPLGILGGGQLARMLVLRAHALGIPVAVLSENQNDPAAQVTAHWQQGSLSSRKDLARFISKCRVTTFESEFLDAALLEKLAKQKRAIIYPKPSHMAVIQDRLSQKNLLIENRLLTAPFCAVSSVQDAEQAFLKFAGQLVFKRRRFGYDGYGTFVVHSVREFEEFLPELMKNAGSTKESGFIAEAFVPFRREIALMIGRSASGQTLALPFVESFQENSRCLWVKGPLTESPRLNKLSRQLSRFLDRTGYVGMMGVELFETETGELIINELAPRVHNSGHYSQDALSESQFGLHLKAILDFEFKAPAPLAAGFAMYNLLGDTDRVPSWQLPADVHLHWYGKKQNRPGRKMGHFNILASNPFSEKSQVKPSKKPRGAALAKSLAKVQADALTRAKRARANFKL